MLPLALSIAVEEDGPAELLALLASRGMPISLDTGQAVVKDSFSWSLLVANDSDKCSNAVALLLDDAPSSPKDVFRTARGIIKQKHKTDSPTGYNYGQHVQALAEVLGHDGRKVLQIAKSGSRQAMYKHLLSGYEVIIM